MALLDDIPTDILLEIVEHLLEGSADPRFYNLQPIASISSKLRQCLLPLLYKDLVLECGLVHVEEEHDGNDSDHGHVDGDSEDGSKVEEHSFNSDSSAKEQRPAENHDEQGIEEDQGDGHNTNNVSHGHERYSLDNEHNNINGDGDDDDDGDDGEGDGGEDYFSEYTDLSGSIYQSDMASRIRHNSSLAQSASGSEFAHRVLLLVNEFADPDEIVRVVRDEMDVANEAKWPNLRSYAYIYKHRHRNAGESFSTSQVAKQLGRLLPVLNQAPTLPEWKSVFSASSASFLTQLTSLTLGCSSQGIDANYLPKFFAPTLVSLDLFSVRPENIWNIFYDGQDKQTVVFASLKRLTVLFENPREWSEDELDHDNLISYTTDLLDKDLARMSLWTPETLGNMINYCVPSFPQLESLHCQDLLYSFRDFVSQVQCQNTLRHLYVHNYHKYFDFDPSGFSRLELVEFRSYHRGWDGDDSTSSPHHAFAFGNLLSSKSNIRKLIFHSFARDLVFKAPSALGCTKLHWLQLRIEVDFNSMLRIVRQLPGLYHLDLGVGNAYFTDRNSEHDEPESEDISSFGEFGNKQASTSLRRFICCVGRSSLVQFYTTAYVTALALHLPSLAKIYLCVDHKEDSVHVRSRLDGYISRLSASPNMNENLLSARVFDVSVTQRHEVWLLEE
ncbi:hypothetical protein GGI12_002020 [Dipsacomyces acuminosporus]|nr:hypothetical protein GGI12_002020 [Dipsacomyces acuminosporus]